MKVEGYSAEQRSEHTAEAVVEKDRREFLKKCGRFAAYTTPAVLLLLHSQNSDASATAVSGVV